MGTLWYGGRIRTLCSEEDVQEAVFVEEGHIVSVGRLADLKLKHEGTISEEINLQGAVMYPGFVDSHLHMIGHGEKLLKLDVSDVTSITRLSGILKKAIKELPPGQWLVAEGFNENLYDQQLVPDKYVLDSVSLHHPIIVSRVCRHASVINTYALQLAGIDKHTPEPAGGIIVRDEHGAPTGYLHDQAQELVKKYLPEQDFTYVEKALSTAVNDLLKKGYTGGHSEDLNYYGDAEATLKAFYNVIDGIHCKFRTNLLIHHEVASGILSNYHQTDHPYVELGAVKIFADGALGGRTALLSKPYDDDPSTCGVGIHTKGELEELIKEARAFFRPVAIHVIGDKALEMAIEAIEAYPPEVGQRDRLIHLQVTREDLIARLQQLPVVLDIQPRFVASDFPWVEKRLGKKRLETSFAWKTFIDKGLMCAGGSDAPIEPIDPMLGIHAAVTRRKPEEEHAGFNPHEKLSLYEALTLFTTGSAKAIGKENVYGKIAKGYKPDFTILTEDLFDLSPDEWLNVKVAKTVVDNTIMYALNQKS
ncbi:amidohydrolase [Salipaludibacillus agaradhaerens]|uniref:amidohydrolase n=1 Tax=Salipaludibacillus agaradhaerens TaxID=76935 RepID=UPI002151A01B|nr:amidohydrolase [Salipaludibacillus agaradhaerens]MCR6107596.1 amidohydrolase [Salipaludibacillus agaradhaerens]MCR6119625.1 amidohydrolase [Salipaludibacillus agaradhaerens]